MRKNYLRISEKILRKYLENILKILRKWIWSLPCWQWQAAAVAVQCSGSGSGSGSATSKFGCRGSGNGSAVAVAVQCSGSGSGRKPDPIKKIGENMRKYWFIWHKCVQIWIFSEGKYSIFFIFVEVNIFHFKPWGPPPFLCVYDVCCWCFCCFLLFYFYEPFFFSGFHLSRRAWGEYRRWGFGGLHQPPGRVGAIRRTCRQNPWGNWMPPVRTATSCSSRIGNARRLCST